MITFVLALLATTPHFPGALTVAGSVELSGNAVVDGNSSAPDTATGCPAGRMAGVTVRDTSSVTVSGSALVSGSPPIQSVDAATFDRDFLLTPRQIDVLRAYAKAHGTYIAPDSGAQLSLSVVDGMIFVDTVRGAPLGDPPDPSVLASVKITAASNAGHIVVMGSVTIEGDVSYDGLIYVLGDLRYKGTGRIEGAVVSANVIPSAPTVIDVRATGNPKIFNDCEKAAFDCSQILGTEREDFFVNYETSGMLDASLNGRPARLDVRRVGPVMLPGCPALKEAVFTHGRSTPYTATFDLSFQDYSLMATLAVRGVETFAYNRLGLGYSRITDDSMDPMINACNGSLPPCVGASGCGTCVSGSQCNSGACVDGRCRPVASCDCPSNVGLAGQPLDQQGSPRYLNPNPLLARCPHGSPFTFERIDNEISELSRVVGEARARSGAEKVSVLGYSVGAAGVGRYLGDSVSYLGETREQRQAKIDKVIFLASTFGGVAEPLRNSWPLGVGDAAGIAGNFNPGVTCLGGDGCKPSGCSPADPDCSCTSPGPDCCPGTDPAACCPTQADPEIPGTLLPATQEHDALGASWGPRPGGLFRYPIVSRFGWNSTVAINIPIPALVIQGKKDSVVAPSTSKALCDALPGGPCANGTMTGQKILVQMNCASHGLLWERVAHASIAKIVGDFLLYGMLFASPGEASGTFGVDASGANYHLDSPIESAACECGDMSCPPRENGECDCEACP